jgi:regulator of sigma E protease
VALGDGWAWFERLPALEEDLKPGDEILSLGGKQISHWQHVQTHLAGVRSGEAVSLRVRGADGNERDVSVQPSPVRVVAPARDGVRMVLALETQASGIGEAAALAGHRTWRETLNVFRMIGSLFSGDIAFSKSVGGPVTIVHVSSEAASRSFVGLLWVMAFVSVTLAVLNILPIPVLDGGHLLFIAMEKIKGSPLTEATMAKMQLVGLMLLLVLMFFAIKNDVVNVIL